MPKATSSTSIKWRVTRAPYARIEAIDTPNSPYGGLLKVNRKYCNICSNHMEKPPRICVDCSACICEQVDIASPGCIYIGTVQDGDPFRCISCTQSHCKENNKLATLPYGFIGYGSKRHAKLTWPLLLVSMQLYSTLETYVRDAMQLGLKQHYVHDARNLHIVNITLRASGQKVGVKEMITGEEFLALSIKSNVPANTFVVFDTHSDTHTGGLQWAGGTTSSRTAPASEVLENFAGTSFIQKLHETAKRARPSGDDTNPIASGSYYDASPAYRGGWRGLLLSTCGPAMRVKHGFDDLQTLVRRGTFDFILGFGGSSTIPSQVTRLLGRVVESIAIDKTADIWDAILQVVSHDPNLLEVNSVVVIYRERGSATVQAREIALHAPPYRPWGVEFQACGTEGCNPTVGDFYVRSQGSAIKMTCRLCGWKSAWVKTKDVEQLLTCPNSTVPNVFWHSYPPSPALASVFVRVTQQVAQ